ncbi:YjeF-like protein [Aeromicrobium marinum DSM 15272]|uniref:Bifunctional NAD(P)H-hydrate repair enzyme n=1 Tax=Aeromicrobium marinum DSM 15272 TaxID=585531 RepID=E2SG42_9ACTN|nr:bifunctional ADP-dependent NAD(P)H-hydrate dehydratase/NAD(P)H-hydrate epimerase [Aeromicrobium marinum]EFQ81799.1 YjeF-like protein [Aeromicrobium marinum DSM 15272]
MLAAHTVADVRRAEQGLADDTGWDVLMQRAARGLADILDDRLPPGATPVVLVGPGHNGGDALFAAAHLGERGRRVNLCLLDPDRVHGPGLAAALAAGASVVDSPRGHTHLVDAVFGIGARPGLEGPAAEWARWQREEDPWTLAVDVPSGVDVDGGTLPGEHLLADVTVTFGTLKPALLLGPAADAAGDVVLVDIGLGPHLATPAVETFTPDDGPPAGHRMTGDGPEHKYSRGVLGVAAGSEAYAGAAHLVVAGAQAGPAGMIRFAGSAELGRRVVDRAPEVVAGPGRVQAWVVGPGGDDGTAELVRAALTEQVPVLLDATALQSLPDRFDVPALLTPHAGELARMLGVSRDDVDDDPWGHARAAASRWGATVLLKGRRTLVVPPEGPTRANRSGTRWLATAGTGDVLAGLAGAWLAAGLTPLEAGSVAAHLHGAAGVRANPGGPVTASGVAAAVPAVTADFLAGDLHRVRDW